MFSVLNKNKLSITFTLLEKTKEQLNEINHST